MKCTNQYKKFTIRNLYKTLEEIMACNPEITMDTEIIISDINMSNFKQEIKVYPTVDYKDRQVKVGLYINPYEKDELLEEPTPQVQPNLKPQVQPVVHEEPYQNIKATEDTPIGLSQFMQRR